MPDKPIASGNAEMFERVVSILESARTNVVRSINSEMVAAYWLIGREIVEEVQKGAERAEYAMQLVENLSLQLNERFGKGFSTTNLKYFRLFYLAFPARDPGGYVAGHELVTQCVTNSVGFMPNLGWSHYRVLMRVEHPDARAYYEREAANNGWSVRQLERQIHSLFFERLLKSVEKEKMHARLAAMKAELRPIDIIKDPYVLEFLDLPESHELTESALEQALISSLQQFLLELGGGFAFVARQMRITLEGEHFYPELVFYHIRLKCYVVVDLKIRKLIHGDVGQMQLYVNYFDREIRGADDQPTVGLLLCTEKNDSMVRYILGEDNEQVFAAKYKLALPTMEELEAELRKERLLIEEATARYGQSI
ncbi:MAG: PDDEXK nuclease domain-containing protein [Kiritimatiellales bacterium]|nr:PDDEXK nuclease domain-containing protein [Kiritimatiellales bacterium]MCF7863186.1 PDDEXK nuclease domain-containing protein [Kiritimatiellales bacterium]